MEGEEGREAGRAGGGRRRGGVGSTAGRDELDHQEEAGRAPDCGGAGTGMVWR